MNIPKTGAALREEIEATLRAAHGRRVDLDALADNVETKLKERDAALTGRLCPRRHYNTGAAAIIGASLPVAVMMFAIGAWFGSLNSGPAAAHTVQPYRQAYFSQLRYDARNICAVTMLQDRLDYQDQDWAPWQNAVNEYISDQRILENARHIVAPNYQDMANVVCPSN